MDAEVRRFSGAMSEKNFRCRVRSFGRVFFSPEIDEKGEERKTEPIK